MFVLSSGASPNPKDDPRAYHQTSCPLSWLTNEPLNRKKNGKRLRAIEGGDKYGLEAVDLCLVLDIGLPIDFKT
ncbi:hypothetical protein CR513_47588, partial [Mucuna pruriens]